MQVFVLADEGAKEELLLKKTGAGIHFTFADKISNLRAHNTADAFFILTGQPHIDDPGSFGLKPVFINSTIIPLHELKLPGNFIRINGWPTFLNREIWEVAAENDALVKGIFERLGWKYIRVDDAPGLVSARIISMIINEAYFAMGDNVSSKEEIDLAMKLGTNYPFGPFEWAQRIGIEKVYAMLQKLSATDPRYAVAPAMKNEISKT